MKLKIDSRKIQKGDTFLAIRELNGDGHNYVDDAIKNGASRVIVEEGNYDADTVIVKDTKKYLEEYLENNYYDDIKDLKLIGMTGTNGKTTTCYLIYQVLNMLNIKCAYIGTIGFYINDIKKELSNTTPNLYELYEILLECKKEKCEYVVMEVSSQGLALGRLNTLIFNFVIFSNLTEDHLDYHKTMENYVKEKQKLFRMTKNSYAIINNDSDYKNYFILDNKNILYGQSVCDYQISDINCSIKGSTFKLNKKKYYTKLIGEYNIYNITVVIIILKLLGIKDIKKIIKKLTPPMGRMEIINNKTNLIIIDYAHTPDAVEKVIKNTYSFKKGKVITLIGCGGNRDSKKRSIMGDIATSYSDYVIFTSDNPRYEDPNKILDDITCKLDKTNYEICVNRRKAIKIAIQRLEKNDILLVLGKGHENYQIIKDKKIHFSDKEEVLKNIRR